MLPSEPAERHRAVAASFTDRVRHVPDWDAPAPVPGWVARDVVAHLVEWFPAFVAAGSPHRWDAGPSVAEDPVAAWITQAEGVQRLLDDPDIAGSPFAHPMVAAQSLAATFTAFYTADVFMHTWDLARATGQDDRLDPDLAGELYDAMVPLEEMLRTSGQYGPPVAVPPDADATDRLMGFIGRDPAWRPGAARDA